jgi:AraC family transcriptional regulator
MNGPPRAIPAGEFYGDLEWTSDHGPCEIRSLAASGREEDVVPHTHEDAHIVIVLSGTYLSTARGAPSLAPGPFVVFNPSGTSHRDRFLGGVGAFMTLSLERLEIDQTADFQVSDTAVALRQPSALAAALQIARECRSRGGDAAALEGAIWDIVASAGQTTATTPRRAPTWAHDAFEAIMDRAEDEGVTVCAVARDLGVHPVHLARVFRSAWGCSPSQLLRWRRAETASRMLLRTDLPAAEIAAAVGFVDQSHMTRAFKTAFGVTPGAWRNAHGVSPIQAAAHAAP